MSKKSLEQTREENRGVWKEVAELLNMLQGNDDYSPDGLYNPKKKQRHPKRSGWWNK